jgi:hypothetical protein
MVDGDNQVLERNPVHIHEPSTGAFVEDLKDEKAISL